MMSIRQAATGLSFAGALLVAASGTMAQTAPSGTRVAQAAPAPGGETSVPNRPRRPLKRLRIYPRYEENPDDVYPSYYPGPNAVRECNATYVQEARPSGTVITPRMHCFWRPG
jgi:hypothetical protein